MQTIRLHRGRRIDPVHRFVRDVAATRCFHAEVLAAPGRAIGGEEPQCFGSDARRAF